MRSFRIASLFAFLGTLLAGSATDSTLPTLLSRNVGEEFEVGIPTFAGVQSCVLVTPNDGTIGFIPANNHYPDKYHFVGDKLDIITPCQAIVRSVEESDAGLWTIRAVTNGGHEFSQSYQLTVNTPTTPAPTESPDDESDKEVRYLPEEHFDTQIGETHDVKIPERDFVSSETCLIITPDGRQTNLQNVNNKALEIITDPNVACGIKVTVDSEEIVGNWVLISRGESLGSRIERRLRFTISVEEKVNAMPSEVSVVEGNDFYVRLEQQSPNPESCRLLGPDGKEYEEYEVDIRYTDACGYIVKSVNANYSGRWQIVYGNRIIYRAPIQVNVNKNGGQGQDQPQAFTWTVDQPVHEVFGPNDTIYCRVIDPKNVVVSDGFGRCNITLPRASSDYDGTWRMIVGLEGRVLTEESTFSVIVVNASPKERVVTNVTSNKPIVTLSCSVSSPYPIRACKFRTPSGRILLASPGVGEDRYTFHGQGSSYESGVHSHDCGIQITNPQQRDLGIWRCGVETTGETYYGFLPALCPWMMRDPEIAASVVSEPTLTADRERVTGLVGDNVVMSCSVQSPIRYCYFRARNGTIFNVGPGGSSTDMAAYAGAGLDSGECSIRFRTLRTDDTGRWSCHVGFEDRKPEQRVNFEVQIDDVMVVSQIHLAGRLYVRGEAKGRELDYCRFVRIDGLGFTDEDIPAPYIGDIRLDRGLCSIWMHDPTILDRHPWTVVMKIRGQSTEISRTTDPTLPPPGPDGPLVIYRIPIYWIIFMVLGLSMIVTAALVGPKKNRRWAYERASNLRKSFRSSFAKKAVNEQNVTEKNTANAA
ncbi:uncharacterized protein [Epargyreus clarus]|uniref:uncharacterized protein n=1 Tax=Epargyreus clarus TaxID=520877 RepID=UPI003C2DB12A